MNAGVQYNLLASQRTGDNSFGITAPPLVVTTDGVLVFDKNKVSVETALIKINYTGDLSLSILADCCNAPSLTIVQIVLTNDYESGDTVHAEYRYVDGDYVSPLQSSLVTFSEGTDVPLVSRYNVTTNFVGTGAFPPAGSVVSLISNKFATDTFVFNPAEDEFKYHVSDTLYGNNSGDLLSLLALATTATPNVGGGAINYADFIVPTLENYLYLIWDFRQSIPVALCYSTDSAVEACCNCTSTPT
jgi:hypothetical protein